MPPFTIYYTLKLLKCQVLLSYYFIFFCVPYIVSTNCHIKEKTHLLTTTAGFRCVYVFYSLSVVCSHNDISSSNCSGVRANTLSIMLCFLSFIPFLPPLSVPLISKELYISDVLIQGLVSLLKGLLYPL